MPTRPGKQRVRESFERAAATYDAAAIVQRAVCERLLGELDRHIATEATDMGPVPRPLQLLDAGCGTGYGIRLLRARWPSAGIVAADFAPAMLELAGRHTDRCCAADIEALPFPPAGFDLWWSSLSIQWCDAPRVFREAARVLRPGGRLAVSTLGPGTFRELRTAFEAVDRYRHTIAFSDAETVTEELSAAGFTGIALRRETFVLHYPVLKDLLRAVKDIGANAVGDGARTGMMGRAAWHALQATYETQRVAEGLPASYDVIFCTAER